MHNYATWVCNNICRLTVMTDSETDHAACTHARYHASVPHRPLSTSRHLYLADPSAVSFSASHLPSADRCAQCIYLLRCVWFTQLPEMKLVGRKKGENQVLYLVLQNAGLLLGVGIMLVIALYEEELQNVVSTDSTTHEH